ncbi:unnamed protein product [Pseudo-nitzschia multistriata]|uniref:Uncharacterized protein n=1 Tax=Pseudo-nitzschia multistriata TaxID=183589 RepID=A0A448ZLM5_9STRA|nr:unnamed protein product [Pseudo-nitzschia multistriata]
MDRRDTNNRSTPLTRFQTFRMASERSWNKRSSKNRIPSPTKSHSLPSQPELSSPPPPLTRLPSFKFPGRISRSSTNGSISRARMPGRSLQRLSSLRLHGTNKDNEMEGERKKPLGPRRIKSLTDSFRIRRFDNLNDGIDNNNKSRSESVEYQVCTNSVGKKHHKAFDGTSNEYFSPPRMLIRRRPVIKINDDKRNETETNVARDNEGADATSSSTTTPSLQRETPIRSNSRRRLSKLKQTLFGSSSSSSKNLFGHRTRNTDGSGNGIQQNKTNELEQDTLSLAVGDSHGKANIAHNSNDVKYRNDESDLEDSFSIRDVAKDNLVMLLLCREFNLIDTNESSSE